MQKSGIKFLNIMPKTIVPLDSAFVFVLYAIYFTAYSDFLQVIISYQNANKQNKNPAGGRDVFIIVRELLRLRSIRRGRLLLNRCIYQTTYQIQRHQILL